MKLSQFNTVDAANNPQAMTLVNAHNGDPVEGGDGQPIKFFLYGLRSDVFRNAARAIERKYGKSEKRTPEEAAEAGAEMLASITQGWTDNFCDDDGSKIEFSRENAIEVYKVADGIADQALKFASDRSHYDPKKSSAFKAGSSDSHGSTQLPNSPGEATSNG